MDKEKREEIKKSCESFIRAYPNGSATFQVTLELIADLEAAEEKLRIAREALRDVLILFPTWDKHVEVANGYKILQEISQ